MNRYVFLLSIVYILVSCKSSPVQTKISSCDSLIIDFKYPDTDSIIHTVVATDKKAIRRLGDFMNGKEVSNIRCGHDGNMRFYSDGVMVLPVVFEFKKDSCRQFLFDLDGKTINTNMSKEAADFLQSLEDGKSEY